MAKGNSERKKISVALQGGGSHGAFSWGVLDRLLEDGRFDIRAVSGTSAGGMNAACLVQGLIQGGNFGARSMLEKYWKSISDLGKSSPIKPTPFDDAQGYHNLDRSPAYLGTMMMTQHLSPYQLSPEGANPLRDFVDGFFDFSLFRKNQDHQIFLATTHVRTGRIKVFTNPEISTEVMLASACLPTMFQAVEIDGEYYWDGGYAANPAIYPLMDLKDAKDILVVQLTKTHCADVPKSRDAINERLKEITYNACLMREMRAIHFISKLIDEGKIKDGALERMNLHLVRAEKALKNLNMTSALNTNWEFLTMLRDAGREVAQEWIESDYKNVGCPKHLLSESLFEDFVG